MAEVITVVGGGVIGLVTAFELTERDQRVRVYDPTPGERGTGASYFAGGMLAPIAEVQFQQDALFPLMVSSADAYPSLMRRLAAVTDAPTGYDTTGTLVVAGDHADAAHLRDVSEYYRSLNRSAEAIPVSRARALEPALAPDLAGAALIEGMVGVLPVDVDKLPADGFKLRQCGCLIVDKAAAFPFGVDDAADAEFFRVFVQKTLFLQLGFEIGQKADVEQCRQLRFLRTAADLAVIGLIAQQKPDCVQRNRFTRARFAGQDGKTTLEIQIEVFNNDKIA